MTNKTIGYTLLVNSAYSEVDWRKAEELQKNIKDKYSIDIRFPISHSGRHRHDTHEVDIPLRSLDLLDDVIGILNGNGYTIEGIRRIFE